MKHNVKLALVCMGLLIPLLLSCSATTEVMRVYTDLKNYNERMVRQADYTKITTPLPRDVVENICLKFELNPDDPRCLPGSVVYGPDFFVDIKENLRSLPHEDATLQTVQDKLGKYLVGCEEPNNEGDYSCTYDLRGDGIYPIGVFFTKDDFFYRVIANTGGS